MIVSRIERRFDGHLPSPAELLAADPHLLRESGMSARKEATLRALAERFVDGRLSDEALTRMTDAEVEAALTEVPGIGPWTARGFLLVGLDRPDVSSPVIWLSCERCNACTDSTTHPPTRSWPSSRTAGGRTGASP